MSVDGREGLQVRVYPSGAADFRFRYTRGSKRYRMLLGISGAGGLSLADAFEAHHQAQRELALGLDPIHEREKRREAAALALQERAESGTVAEVVAQFVHRKLRAERWHAERGAWVRDEKTKTKARKRPDAAAALLGYVPPGSPAPRRKGKRKETLVSKYGSLKARDLTKRQIIDLLDAMTDRGAPVSANRTYALLKQFFNWAAAKDLIPASPMAGVERPGGEERARERVLSADEIQTVWNKLATAEMADPTRLAIKLLLVTGQRRGELTQAKWSHFDLEGKRWTIPAELLKSSHSRKTKTEAHIVPLSDLAIELLTELKNLTGEGVFVLPAYADKTRSASYSDRVLSRAVRENQKHFGIPHWTPHDLRRTAASMMTSLKLPRLHVEKVLNHATGDIAEVYDRHDYLPEKTTALEKWGGNLADLVGKRSST